MYSMKMASTVAVVVTPEIMAEMKVELTKRVSEYVRRSSMPSMYKRWYIEGILDDMIKYAIAYFKYSLPVHEVLEDIPIDASLEGLSETDARYTTMLNAFRAYYPVYLNMHNYTSIRFKGQYHRDTRARFIEAVVEWHKGDVAI